VRRALWRLRQGGVQHRLVLRETARCGLGVFAEENIPSGTVLVEYVGEVLNRKEVGWRGWPGA
jgi:SET domain-containing protein